MIGRRDLEFIEEHVRHVRVIMLAGVDEHLGDAGLFTQPERHDRRLDELRSGADDGDDFHVRDSGRSGRIFGSGGPHGVNDAVLGVRVEIGMHRQADDLLGDRVRYRDAAGCEGIAGVGG